MRRRKIDVENLGENTQISLKLPKKILDWIEEACAENPEFTGRSHFIDNACRYYLNLKPCHTCGELNPRDAVACAYCRAELDGMKEIAAEIRTYVSEFERLHEEGFALVDECISLNNGIEEYIESQKPSSQKYIRIELAKLTERFDKRIQNALDYFEVYRSKTPNFKPYEYQQNFDLKIPDYSTLLEKCCTIIYGTEYMVKCEDEKNRLPVYVELGLYYYNIAKNVLEGDSYSLKEINNLITGFDFATNTVLGFVETLRDAYSLLNISKNLAVLVAHGH